VIAYLIVYVILADILQTTKGTAGACRPPQSGGEGRSWSPPLLEHHKTGLSRLRHRLGPAVCVKFGEYRGDVKFGRVE
jgi:hypothetical protein